MIGLVDQDGRSRFAPKDVGDELLNLLSALKRAGRVVRVAHVIETSARGSFRHSAEVKREPVGDWHGHDRVPQVPRELHGHLEGRHRCHQRAVRRGEGRDRGVEDFAGAAPELDLVGRNSHRRGNRVDELVGRGEGVSVDLAERVLNRGQHPGTRAAGVLVGVQPQNGACIRCARDGRSRGSTADGEPGAHAPAAAASPFKPTS